MCKTEGKEKREQEKKKVMVVFVDDGVTYTAQYGKWG